MALKPLFDGGGWCPFWFRIIRAMRNMGMSTDGEVATYQP